MQQVLLNLITNAMKFSNPDEGIIQIIVQGDDELRVSIVDNGAGIPEDHLPYIFERFYKSKQKQANQGTGLGLAICKEIVEYHGGQIGAMSNAGQGTLIYFTLPLHERVHPNS